MDGSLKKIGIEELKIGMFIVNLGRSWFTHPFLRNQLLITSEKQLQKLRKYGIREVYIDSQRGLDVPYVPASNPSSENKVSSISPDPEERDPDITIVEGPDSETFHPIALETGQASSPPDNAKSMAFWQERIGNIGENLSSMESPSFPGSMERISYSREIRSARLIKEEAQNVVRNVMQDIRMGRSIESDRMKRVVNTMVDSILRNEDALVSLTRIKNYDEYTFVHSLDVCIFCLSMGRHLSLSREEMLELGIGALLHDVGKMRIPSQILKKPASLTANEWIEMRKHPIYSREVMEQCKEITENSKQMALQHHERYNGSGYPFGLKGDAIGMFGQLAAIVDFYDAITSDRPYQKAIQPHDGIRQIYERSQVEFNRLLVERFIQCIGIYPFGTLVLLDSEEMGIVCGVNSETLIRPKVLVTHQNSKLPYPDPFLCNLMEKSEHSQWYKRSIVMPLDPHKWNIDIESYFPEIRKKLNELPA